MTWRPTERQLDMLALATARRHGLDWAETRAAFAALVERSALARMYLRLALWLDGRLPPQKRRFQ